MGSTPQPQTLTSSGLNPTITGVVNAPGGVAYNFIPNIPQPVNGKGIFIDFKFQPLT